MMNLKTIIPLIGLLPACGDETLLSRYVAEPIPQSTEVHRAPPYVPPDYTAEQPGLSLNVTMQHCLGPLTEELRNLDALCPLDVDGVCDPAFEVYLSGLPARVMEIIREDVPFINPFDLLDGEVSIPVTALVTGGVAGDAFFESSEATEPFKVMDRTYASMLIVLGDVVEEVNEYLTTGNYLLTRDDDNLQVNNFPYGNFPINHLRCVFSRSVDREDDQWHQEHVSVAYISIDEDTLEYSTPIALEFEHKKLGEPWSENSYIKIRTEQGFLSYSEQNHNINTLRYAIDDISDEGINRAKELLGDKWDLVPAVFHWE
jgi:hypothetical protein